MAITYEVSSTITTAPDPDRPYRDVATEDLAFELEQQYNDELGYDDAMVFEMVRRAVHAEQPTSASAEDTF